MSTTIGTGYGILPSLTSNASAVHQQLDTLTEQVSTGLVAQTYAGLGSQAGLALDLNPQISALQAYQTNISQATGSMQVTQTAMTQIQQIASTFADDIPNLNNLNPSETDSIAAQANQALQQVADLLNTQDAGNYVFAGQDTGNPPVPSGDAILSSGFYTQINAAVASLSTNGASATRPGCWPARTRLRCRPEAPPPARICATSCVPWRRWDRCPVHRSTIRTSRRWCRIPAPA